MQRNCLLLQQSFDLAADLFNRSVAVKCVELVKSLCGIGLIVIDKRLGLPVINFKTLENRLLLVVISDNQRLTGNIIYTFLLRRIVNNCIFLLFEV